MDRLVLLVGPSGSGKTTIAKELEKEGYNIIHSYTTRAPREPNEWGHTFVSKNEINHVPEWEIIALRELYNDPTKPGDYYFATKEQYRGKGTSIYVVCPDGARQVQENVNDAKVKTIFLQCDRYVRYDRMVADNRGLLDVKNRLDKDEKIFSKCKCDYVVDANRELEQVITDIKEIIKESN